MRLSILSDLHLEFAGFTPATQDVDAVILAGDVHVGLKGIEWARERFPEIPVLYVPGNHEYYGHALPRHTGKMRDACAGTSVHVLAEGAARLAGVTFLGCTLWTDFELLGDPRISGYHATTTMNDYRRIRLFPGFRRLRSVDTAVINRRSQIWLEAQFEEHEEGPLVVITHHAPSPRSLYPGYEHDLLSAAYASDLERLVRSSNAALWVHGHTHRAADYCIGSTRVVCNPRGYPGEDVEGFTPELVVDIGE